MTVKAEPEDREPEPTEPEAKPERNVEPPPPSEPLGPMPQLVQRPVSRPPDRLTVTFNIYHSKGGRQPAGLSRAFDRILTNRGHYDDYEIEVGKTPVPFDLGELGSDVGLLVIENTSGTNPSKIYSDEEKAEIERRVVRIRSGKSAGIVVRPGHVAMFETEDATQFIMQCLDETPATVWVHCFPR